MKAFVTICSLLAGSASVYSQYIQNVVPFNQPMGISSHLIPYGVFSPPMGQVSYASMAEVEPSVLTYGIPSDTLVGQMLVKREAEPETAYAYKAKVDNPEDGTKYMIDVQVDQLGNGQSHQQIERQPNYETLMDPRMEQNVNDLRQRNQIRMDNSQMGRMLSEQSMMGQRQRMSYNTGINSNRMSQRMRNQMMRDHEPVDSMTYSMMDQRQMENMNQRMQDINMMQRNMDMVDRRMMHTMAERNQMQSRRMIKREANPSFQYTIAAEHPIGQSRRRMSQNMRNQVYGDELGLMNQRMAANSNMRRMDDNLVNQMVRDNMMHRNLMHPRTMIKREADSFMAYNLPLTYGHPMIHSLPVTHGLPMTHGHLMTYGLPMTYGLQTTY